METDLLKKACSLLCILGVVSIAVSMFFEVKEFSGALNFLALWTCSPYFFMGASSSLALSKPKIISNLILTGLLCFSTLFFLIASRFYPDAQGGLIYIFLPAWQWAGLILWGILFHIIHRLYFRSSKK